MNTADKNCGSVFKIRPLLTSLFPYSVMKGQVMIMPCIGSSCASACLGEITADS